MATTPPSDGDLSAVIELLDTAGIAVALIGPDGLVRTTNDSFARVCGRPSGELANGVLADSILADDRQSYRDLLAAVVSEQLRGADAACEARFVGADGRVRPVRLNVAPLSGSLAAESGVDGVLMCVASDRGSERRRERADRKARVLERTGETTDPSTGLLNQRGLDMTLESAARRAMRNESVFALIRCEIADDSAGSGETVVGTTSDPATREEAVMACVDRVRQRLRPSDTVARIADSLVVVAEDLGDEQDAAGVTYRILSTVVEPVPSSHGPVALSMVAGIAVADGSPPVHKMLATSTEAATRAADTGGFHLTDLRRPTA